MDLTKNDINIKRLPKSLQNQLESIYFDEEKDNESLALNEFHHGNALKLIPRIKSNHIALSVWSPPYFVGKSYESDLSFADWKYLLSEVIKKHFRIIKPGGFLSINIADILCFKDPEMPRIQAESISRRRIDVTKEDILDVLDRHPEMNKYQLAAYFNCSEQTIDRRLNGNNIRGGKSDIQTRVKIVGGLVEEWALDSGFYPYDRRVWVKDAAWENSRWASLSYRSVDEFEYIYIFWKPGVTKYNRERLTNTEWKEWGSRGVWHFPSVRSNSDHEAKFPVELPLRLIKLLTEPEDIIMDCFMGSGTTAIAAIREKRHFIGIESEKKYVELSKKRALNELNKYTQFTLYDH
jgi:site-specific DNA-methyltransferase (adenine-specific)